MLDVVSHWKTTHHHVSITNGFNLMMRMLNNHHDDDFGDNDDGDGVGYVVRIKDGNGDDDGNYK